MRPKVAGGMANSGGPNKSALSLTLLRPITIPYIFYDNHVNKCISYQIIAFSVM